VYPDNYALPPSAWFITDTISADQICAKLNLIEGDGSTQAVVLRVLGGAGFVAADVWEWLKARREKAQFSAQEITTQGPRPANHEEDVTVQHDNAPPLTQEPARDLAEPPTRDPPADQVTYARSRPVPFAVVRTVIIFIAGVLATFVWQSWGGTAGDALNAVFFPRAGLTQGNHDTPSAPSPSR